MDPNPRNYPILSYVMSKLPKLGSFKPGSTTTDHLEPDIENQPPRSPSSPGRILDHMPRLTDPKILAEMTRAISEIAQTRSVLQILGERPDHEAVDTAKVRIAEIDANLSKELEEITLSPPPQSGADVNRLRLEKEKERKEAATEERRLYGAVIELDEMHEAYGKLLKEAEEKLVKIYESADVVGEEHDVVVEEGNEEGMEIEDVDEMNDEVAGVLKEGLANGLERVDLSGRGLRFMPEAFGKIRGLVVLDLSSNQLKAIPDSVAGLNNLEELKLSSNLLESLPDSIGMLHSLKILDVSKNKLNTLPDSICHCKSLVELDASYNKLTYLPTNIGYELVNLRRLSIHLNKLRSLPSSICEMTSLCHLDAHFNELHGLPLAIGRLTNLESLNLSSNFNDMTQLPETFGDLINLKELDLSNNQIHALPDTFCRLQNLNTLNLDQNPIVIPPVEVVNQGVMAVMVFMTKRLHEILAEQERKSMLEIKEQTQTGWLTRSTSWLNNFVSGVSGNVTGYLAPKSPTDPFLDQQL